MQVADKQWDNASPSRSASSPRVLALGSFGAIPLELENLELQVAIHMCVAFVKCKVTFKYTQLAPGGDRGFVFELPTRPSATVTSAVVHLPHNKSFETLVVEASPSLEQFRNKEGRGLRTAMDAYRDLSGRSAESFESDLFSLPFHGLKKGESVTVELDYIDQLMFFGGEFIFDFPLTFANGVIPAGKTARDVCNIRVEMNTGTKKSAWSSASHPFKEDTTNAPIADLLAPQEEETKGGEGDGMGVKENSLVIIADKSEEWPSPDVQVKFQYWEEEIGARALFQKGQIGQHDSTVALFLSPPGQAQASEVRYQRHAVFIIDRSGSMGFSNIMDQAKQALITGLQELKEGDRFAICAFDENQYWFAGADINQIDAATESANVKSKEGIVMGSPVVSPETPVVQTMEGKGNNSAEVAQLTRKFMVPVSSATIGRAVAWVETISPGGLTDILTPLNQAIVGLGARKSNTAVGGDATDDAKKVTNHAGAIPMVFLITDGAVDNEREICSYVKDHAEGVRLFTFGIGHDCNAYFLRKLASLGRGYTDVALKSFSLQQQMSNLIDHARLPVLTDLSMVFQDEDLQQRAEWFPPILPDLFFGAPVIASCRLPSSSPDTVVELNQSGSGFTNIHLLGILPHAKKKKKEGGGELEDLGVHMDLPTGPEEGKWGKDVRVRPCEGIPLHKVFAQQRLENLITQSWFVSEDAPEWKGIRDDCVKLAVDESLPCAYTQMVVRETTADEIEARKQSGQYTHPKLLTGRRVAFIGAGVAGAAAFGVATAALIGGGEAVGALADGAGDCCCCGECDDCDVGECADVCLAC